MSMSSRWNAGQSSGTGNVALPAVPGLLRVTAYITFETVWHVDCEVPTLILG